MLKGLRHLAAALWLGLVASLGGVVAPVLFMTLERVQAGAIAGQLFRIEAQAALALGVVLLLLERHQAAQHTFSGGHERPLSTEMLLVLGALFCTVLGYFALQPMMAAARAGTGSWTFWQLHALSSGFFALKGLCLLALVWRQR